MNIETLEHRTLMSGSIAPTAGLEPAGDAPFAAAPAATVELSPTASKFSPAARTTRIFDDPFFFDVNV
jgi:hypothetical protein